jgi:hypothetical protein
MIYCVPPELYPKQGMFIEEISYKDENDFEWKIARIENGFMVKYFGDSHFMESSFEVEDIEGNYLQVKNTNCIFFSSTDFDTFCEVRDILKSGYTDDIWECFEDLFVERFKTDGSILESERV